MIERKQDRNKEKLEEKPTVDNEILTDCPDLIDWSEKFNITLTVLINEYNVYIQSVKDVDEKANKYLLAISIFITGFFTLISTSLNEELRFNYPLEIRDLLSWFFIFCAMMTGFFSFLVIRNILASFAYVESKRLPDLASKLDDFGESNSTEYKNELIECYQECINFIEGTIKEKQRKVKSVYPNMQRAIVCVLCSFLLLFLVKLLP